MKENGIKETRALDLNGENLSLGNEETTQKYMEDKSTEKLNSPFLKPSEDSYDSKPEADLGLNHTMDQVSRNKKHEHMSRRPILDKNDKLEKCQDHRKHSPEKTIEEVNKNYEPDQSHDEESKESFFCEYDSKNKKWVVNHMLFLEWLQGQGVLLIEEGQKNNFFIVHVKNNIVKKLSEEALKIFVMKTLRKHRHDHEIEAVHKNSSKLFSKWVLNSLPLERLKFLEDTENSAYLFFPNIFVEITDKGYETHKYSTKLKEDMKLYVWENHIIRRHFLKNVKGMGEFERFVRNAASYPTPPEGFIRKKRNEYGYYFHRNKYDVIQSALGEKAHSYKNPQEAVITVFVDQDMEDDIAQGGTGKSLIARALEHIIKGTVILDGKNVRPQNRFNMQNVEHDTRIVIFDDVNKNFKIELLFQLITGDFSFEKKGKQRVVLPFAESPKIVITSNYPILGEGASFERRQHIVEISDFYHKNDVREVHEDILFSDYDWDSKEWSRFFIFMINCISFYLKKGLQKLASEAYRESKLRNECSSGFVDWADDFFKPGRTYEKDRAYSSFLDVAKMEEKEFSKHKFTGTLKKYACGRGLEVNPDKPKSRDRRSGTDYLTLVKK